MQFYNVHAFFKLEDGPTLNAFQGRIRELEERPGTVRGTVGGTPDRYIFSVTLMAASAEDAIDIWYSDVDPEIDEAKLRWNVAPTSPPRAPSSCAARVDRRLSCGGAV